MKRILIGCFPLFLVLCLIWQQLALATSNDKVVSMRYIHLEDLYPKTMALHNKRQFHELEVVYNTSSGFVFFDSFEDFNNITREFARTHGLIGLKYRMVRQKATEVPTNLSENHLCVVEGGYIFAPVTWSEASRETIVNYEEMLSIAYTWLNDARVYNGMPQQEAVWAIVKYISSHVIYDYSLKCSH